MRLTFLLLACLSAGIEGREQVSSLEESTLETRGDFEESKTVTALKEKLEDAQAKEAEEEELVERLKKEKDEAVSKLKAEKAALVAQDKAEIDELKKKEGEESEALATLEKQFSEDSAEIAKLTAEKQAALDKDKVDQAEIVKIKKEKEELEQKDKKEIAQKEAELTKIKADKEEEDVKVTAMQAEIDKLKQEKADAAAAPAPEAKTKELKALSNAEALEAVKQAKAKLLEYYEGDKEILEKAVIQSVKAADAILIARMALIMLGKRDKDFVISVGGSSVTAGHDGFETASWPKFLERQLKPLWENLGVQFTVRNQAVGGRNPNPWPFCVSPMFGEDADVVMREWEYWPFNAGFNGLAITKERADPQVASIEILLRNALLMEKQPAIHFVKMSPDRNGGGLSWMSSYFRNGGSLGNYNKFALLGFDNFGAGFSHLRKKAPKQRTNKNGKGSCSGSNVNDCPVDVKKQDGHHERATYPGYDVKKHPGWEKWASNAGFKRLFINWHPAPLAHEVIGNQVAYYHMGLMEAALSKVIANEDALDLEGTAAIQPIPAAEKCKDEVCTFLGEAKPKCAYSYLPKAEGPDVGDWMVNETKHGWVNAPTRDGCKDTKQRCTNDPNQDSETCFQAGRQCSYLDQKRGFVGNAGSGAITFKMPEMYHCKIWIGEPGYEWNKPREMANWALEMEVKVNGEVCRPPNCKVAQDGYLQTMVIDARAILGGKCRRQDVVVSLEIKPTEDTKVTCNKKCEPDGHWNGYAANICKSHECSKSKGPHPHGVDGFGKRYQKKEEIKTFISQIITF